MIEDGGRRASRGIVTEESAGLARSRALEREPGGPARGGAEGRPGGWGPSGLSLNRIAWTRILVAVAVAVGVAAAVADSMESATATATGETETGSVTAMGERWVDRDGERMPSGSASAIRVSSTP